MPKKLKGRTLWGFSTSILSQDIKKLKGEKFLFSEKNLTVPKKLKGGTLWDFPTSILSQNSKKIEEGPLGPFGLAWYGMLRGETGETFLVQFARPNGAIWCNNILYNFVELFWSLQVVLKKH